MPRLIIETLAQVDMPLPRKRGNASACVGIVLWDDKVVEAAPLLRFMKRWSRAQVREYCARKGWPIQVVTETKRTVD